MSRAVGTGGANVGATASGDEGPEEGDDSLQQLRQRQEAGPEEEAHLAAHQT